VRLLIERQSLLCNRKARQMVGMAKAKARSGDHRFAITVTMAKFESSAGQMLHTTHGNRIQPPKLAS